MSNLTLEQCQNILNNLTDGELYITDDKSMWIRPLPDIATVKEYLWDCMVTAAEDWDLVDIQVISEALHHNLAAKCVIEGDEYRMFADTASDLQLVFRTLCERNVKVNLK